MATGVFGGTFDPVHIGHLRTALELRDYLSLERMLLLPCGDPPHRATPGTPADRRLAMVELAIGDEPGLAADAREVERAGLSYMVDTLADLRRELGPDAPLCLCIGMDSLTGLNTWNRWHELLDHAHVVVAARPGWDVPRRGELAEWLSEHGTEDPSALLRAPAGRVHIAGMTLLPISATGLRDTLRQGRSARYLTPDPVLDYIRRHRLYRPQPSQTPPRETP